MVGEEVGGGIGSSAKEESVSKAVVTPRGACLNGTNTRTLMEAGGKGSLVAWHGTGDLADLVITVSSFLCAHTLRPQPCWRHTLRDGAAAALPASASPQTTVGHPGCCEGVAMLLRNAGA